MLPDIFHGFFLSQSWFKEQIYFIRQHNKVMMQWFAIVRKLSLIYDHLITHSMHGKYNLRIIGICFDFLPQF